MKRLFYFYLFPFAFCLGSCSPQQRLAHLLKRHPELVKQDTVWHLDTFRIHEVYFDTVLKNQITRDTIIIKQDRLTIKYFNSRDSVFISGKCDSIVKLVNVPVNVNTVSLVETTHWYDAALRWFFAFIILLGIYRLISLYVSSKPKL